MTEAAPQAPEMVVSMPPKLVPVFTDAPGEVIDRRGARGGRGSGKSRTFHHMAAVFAMRKALETHTPWQVLIARQYQNSINDSSFFELVASIQSCPVLSAFYDCGKKYVRSRLTVDGTANTMPLVEFSFCGLARSISSVRSKSRLLLVLVEEAEDVTDEAWRELEPTVREEGSELWMIWNPKSPYSATHQRYGAEAVKDDPNSKIIDLNYTDNPFFTDKLERQRLRDRKVMEPEMYNHVWEGAFLMFREGAYYRKEMRRAGEDGRVGNVPHDPLLPVWTAWDLGMSDSTAIWFAQFAGAEVRLIDYEEHDGEGLAFYADLLTRKPYKYAGHILPHDIKVREMGTGKSRLETIKRLGVEPVRIVSGSLSLDDGIQSVRGLLSQCWFDARKCKRGLDSLQAYCREYDEDRKTYKNTPVHDWASHGADAMRYLTLGYRPGRMQARNQGVLGSGGGLKRKLRGILT